MASSSLWQRFQRYFLEYRDLCFSLDIRRMKFPDDLFEKMRRQIEHAFATMRELEAGAIANPTENRMVGHYWLRSPVLAPTAEIRSEIEDTIQRIKAFAQDVHTGKSFRGEFRFRLDDRRGARFEVEDGITSGDYLEGFLRGTRGALYEKGRESITMSIPEVNAFYIGALIALYERAVGFYGPLVNINAYDEPGVEAGKNAASKLLQLQKQVRAHLSGESKTSEEIAHSVDADPEDVFHLLRHLASNDPPIKVATGDEPADDRFSLGQFK
jgi:glucose-6-phosphate isomerase